MLEKIKKRLTKKIGEKEVVEKSLSYDEFIKKVPPEHFIRLKSELHDAWYREFNFENLYIQPIEEGFAKWLPYIGVGLNVVTLLLLFTKR